MPRPNLSLPVLKKHFPHDKYPVMRPNQGSIHEFVAENGSSLIESPTGSGKTACEYAILKAVEEVTGGKGALFLITPSKAILDQMHNEFPDLKVALGRNEHECLYYEDEQFKADEIPCSMLVDCPHRVSQLTGETLEPNVTPCPYYQQKWKAKQGGPVLCTHSFYLFTALFTKEWGEVSALVIDEAHRLPDVVRNSLSYEITDHHIMSSIALLRRIKAPEAKILHRFLKRMKGYIKKKPIAQGTLLEPSELRGLMDILSEVDVKHLGEAIKQARKDGLIDTRKDVVVLRKLEVLVRDMHRYIRSFEFSLQGDDGRSPLSYTYAFYRAEKRPGEKVQYKLVVKCYYVAPLIRKILAPLTVSLSATIGDPDVFGYESGIRDPFISLDSDFPAENTRVYMPTDTPNLAMNVRSKHEPTKVLRRIAKACKDFAKKEMRSLVVTVSNDERDKFLMLCAEEGVNAVSYGNGVTAKDAALAFKEGKGDVLVGTAANYAEGVDLPKQIAPVIFFLRPGYPNPKDPGTVFEERRFGGRRWAIWNWRVMLQALQVRGRNIRSVDDLGVTFFVSQQFKRFVFASLPKYLQKAYKNEWTLDQCIADAMKLLK